MAIYESASGAKTQVIFSFQDNSDPTPPNNTTPSNNTTHDDPIVPDTGGEIEGVPDTGVFTGTSSSNTVPAIMLCSAVLIAAAIFIYRRKKFPHIHHSLSFSSTHLNIRDTKTLAKNLGIFAGVSLAVILLASVVIPNFITSKNPSSFAESGNVIEFSVSEKISGTADLSSKTPIAYATLVLNVGKPNYSLYVSTNSDSSDGNKMKLDGESKYLNPTSGTIASPGSLNANEWGMAYGSDAKPATAVGNLPVFISIPKYSSSPLRLPDSTAPTYNLLFAARGDKNTTKPGSYATTILFTAIAPLEGNPIDQAFADAGKEKQNGYYKMQDMSSSICNAVSVPTTTSEDISTQLIDVRDNKVYWITKLKDGNCWMTQNLDYDLSVESNKTLHPETSDVASTTTLTITPWSTDFSGVNYLDGGDKYYANDTTIVDTSGLSAGDSEWHHHIGSYYSWNTATASTSTSSTEYSNAPDSICPKGWKLPTYYEGSESALGDFEGIYQNYVHSTTDTSYLNASPIYLFGTGFVTTDGSIYNNGLVGYTIETHYWSSTIGGENRAYDFGYKTTEIPHPNIPSPRHSGFSVRCIAKKSDPVPDTSCSSSNKICYDKNGADGGSMAEQDITANSSVTLYPSNFWRSGYGFAGWNTKPDGTGTQYGPMETITTPSTLPDDGVRLYARWIESAGTLQGWTGCAGMQVGDVTALTDSRDNDTYAIAKLADGNCWMIENLRLDNDATHNSDGSLAQGYAPGFIGLANPEIANFAKDDVTSNSLYSTSNIIGDFQYARFPRYNNSNTASPVNNSDGTDNTYSYGNYYTWSAAIADTALYSGDSKNVTTSICPKGWMLPIGVNDDVPNSYYHLNIALNNNMYVADATSSINFRKFPNNFLYPGYVTMDYIYDIGTRGEYWSSSSGVGDLAESLSFVLYNNYAGYSYFSAHNHGLSVRCIVGTADSTRKTFDQAFADAGKEKQNGYYKMQDMSSSVCNAVASPTTTSEDISTQLIDTRDNKIYWVSKLKDGNCWMTQNLDYDIKSTGNEISSIDGTTTTWNSPNGATGTSVFHDSSDTGTYSYDPGSKYLPNGVGAPTDITCNSNTNGGTNCHYHLGNYYQWNAATASTGGTNTSSDATASICPKGWRLPSSKSYSDNYSFGRLTNLYGVTNNAEGSNDATLLSSPLWFVRAGAIYLSGDLLERGEWGELWSNQASSDTYYALHLRFGNTRVLPSSTYYRAKGINVRCVNVH